MGLFKVERNVRFEFDITLICSVRYTIKKFGFATVMFLISTRPMASEFWRMEAGGGEFSLDFVWADQVFSAGQIQYD